MTIRQKVVVALIGVSLSAQALANRLINGPRPKV